MRGEARYKGGGWDSPRSALGLQGGEEGWRQQDVQREPSSSHCYCGASLTSPKLMRLACFRISVSPSRSFILRYLGKVGVKEYRELTEKVPASSPPPFSASSPTRSPYLRPPRFFRCPSRGAGRGFTCFTGGGSCHLSNLRSISSFSS